MSRWTRTGTAALAVALFVTTGTFVLAGCGGKSATAGRSNRPGFNGQWGGLGTMLARQLDPLVQQGTITSDQEKAVLAAFQKVIAGRMQGGQAPYQGGQSPAPGVQQQQPRGGAMFASALAALVKSGTITSAQSEAISQALMSGRRGFAPPSGAPPAQSL
jgi:hypothetical protein